MSLLETPDTPDDGVYHVYALPYARQMNRRANEGYMAAPAMEGGDPHNTIMPMLFYVWILHNRHRTIVVDSGHSKETADRRGRPIEFNPIDGLARIGVDPDLVEDVIITHLHYDHAGNIDRFGKARFHIQQTEVAFATGPCMCSPFMRMPFDVEDVITLMRRLYADRVRFYDGEAAPFPGVSLHILPGHSAGIQAVRVMTSRGPVLLASDVSHYYANFIRGIPFRLTVDVGASMRSYQRLMEIAGSVDRIIPGHDPKVEALYPKIEVNGVGLVTLHEPPVPHTVADLIQFDRAR